MKIFTTALLTCATVMGVSAQEMIYEDDFSWLNNPNLTTSATLHDTSNENDNKFLPNVLTAKGIQNPGWSQGVFDLNAEHTQRLQPEPGVEPENFFDHPYNTVWMRPGYLKIGYTNFAGAIIAPAMEKLGDRTADVEVTFQMCGYTSKGSAAKPGNKDETNVYVGLWDGCDGEMEDADHEQLANQWYYECKALKVTNYYHSLNNEYGEDYDPWNKDISLYKVVVNGAKANTRLYIFAGGYGSEIANRDTNPDYPTSLVQTVNGEEKTFNFKPNINRIGLKGCWVKVLKVTDEGNAGIDEVEADSDAPAEYFNLQGIRVANPAQGNIYIKRQGSKVTKIAY